MNTYETLLGDVRVLDLSDEKGVYCAKLFADHGADVLRIEPPSGHPMRNLGPFVDDEPHSEKSLYWWHFNTSKRGITLDLENTDGHNLFKKLVKTADIVLETYPPGYLGSLGLGYQALNKLNPEIIVTSITPFGQTGPYKDFAGSDMVAQAMGGLIYLAGFTKRTPYRLAASQAYHSASVQASVGTLVALYTRDFTGVGQTVEVSIQESVMPAMEVAMQFFDLRKEIRTRQGREKATVPGIGLYRCKDGYVSSGVFAGAGGGWDQVIDWMDGVGMAGDLKDPKWDEVLEIMLDINELTKLVNDQKAFRAMLDKFAIIDDLYKTFLESKNKQQIFDEAAERRLMIVPVQTVEDLVNSPQLNALDFFQEVEHPELGMTVKYPGAPCYEISDSPWRISRRAPLLGEHNREIYEKELGLSKEQLVQLKRFGAI